MKTLGMIIIICVGSLLIYATGDFPYWGDPNAPASRHVSPRYLEKTIEETQVPNVVTSVLADYRGFDTMFETTVIFAAGIACVFLLRIFTKNEKEVHLYRHIPTGVTLHLREEKGVTLDSDEFERIDRDWTPPGLIVKTIGRILIPFIQLFALYVIAHGHYSPGGGFQGGVILGASFILYAISYNLRKSLIRMSEKINALLCALGVFIYAGIGMLCLLLGSEFLDYKALSIILPVDVIYARSLGILFVEIGVGIAVMATMVCIYNHVASAGKMDEGL